MKIVYATLLLTCGFLGWFAADILAGPRPWPPRDREAERDAERAAGRAYEQYLAVQNRSLRDERDGYRRERDEYRAAVDLLVNGLPGPLAPAWVASPGAAADAARRREAKVEGRADMAPRDLLPPQSLPVP